MSERKIRNPAERLRDAAKIRDERGQIYGDNYKYGGMVLLGLFPNGLTLETEEEFNRFLLMSMLVVKVSRYAQNLKRGGHEDSLNDLAVYSQLLAEYDEECRSPAKEVS